MTSTHRTLSADGIWEPRVSDMIERVARALWDDWQANGKTKSDAADGLSWDQIVAGAADRPKIQDIVDDARSQARAAIAAMREPSENQKNAGIGLCGEYIGAGAQPSSIAVETYRHMINAALSESHSSLSALEGEGK